MRKPWILVLLIALLGAMGLVACGDDDDDSSGPGGEVYKDPQGRFALTLPKDWIQDRSGQAEVNLAFVATQDDPSGGAAFRPNIAITITEDIQATLAQAARAYREQNVRSLPNYDPNIDERIELSDGTPAQLIGGIYQQDELRLQVLQLLVAAPGVGYVVQATNPVASYPGIEDVLRGSLESFTLDESNP